MITLDLARVRSLEDPNIHQVRRDSRDPAQPSDQEQTVELRAFWLALLRLLSLKDVAHNIGEKNASDFASTP